MKISNHKAANKASRQIYVGYILRCIAWIIFFLFILKSIFLLPDALQRTFGWTINGNHFIEGVLINAGYYESELAQKVGVYFGYIWKAIVYAVSMISPITPDYIIDPVSPIDQILKFSFFLIAVFSSMWFGRVLVASGVQLSERLMRFSDSIEAIQAAQKLTNKTNEEINRNDILRVEIEITKKEQWYGTLSGQVAVGLFIASVGGYLAMKLGEIGIP